VEVGKVNMRLRRRGAENRKNVMISQLKEERNEMLDCCDRLEAWINTHGGGGWSGRQLGRKAMYQKKRGGV